MVGGYADVISLHRWKAFATMLTGNTIWLGRVLLGHTPAVGELYGPCFYLAIILAFFIGVMLHRWADRTWQHRGASRIAPSMALVNLTCEFVVFTDFRDADLGRLKWFVVLYTPLFGVLCAASADGRLGSATTMVTGHVVSIAKAVANLPVKEFTFGEKMKVMMSFVIVCGSVAGATLASAVYHHFNYQTAGLFIPVTPCLVVLLWCHDHLARPHKLVKMYQKAARRRRRRKQAEDSSPIEDTPMGDTPEDDEVSVTSSSDSEESSQYDESDTEGSEDPEQGASEDVHASLRTRLAPGHAQVGG